MAAKLARSGSRVTAAMIVASLVFETVAATEPKPPAAIAAYVERRLGCNHWLGEDGYDREREAEIEAAVKRLRCATIDRDERVLRRRYAGKPIALTAIERARHADQ